MKRNKKIRPTLAFVATSPFAVNAFLRVHLLTLMESYNVYLYVDTRAYPLADELTKLVNVVHIDIERKPSPWRDLRALVKLVKHFRDTRPDAVHSITPKAGLLAMVAARISNIPHRIHTFTGQVWANTTGIARHLMKSLDRAIVFCATNIFADSESQCRFLENQRIVRPGDIKVLGNGSISGVDLQRFRRDTQLRSRIRASFGVPMKTKVFLFVGRIVRDKGVSDLIEAFALVNTVHPKWELWLVGPNEAGLQGTLTERASELGLRVRWHGSTDEPEAFMNAADIFVLPSYREGFGSVIIEAAACGIPTIAYRIDGVVDAVLDNKTGCLIEKGNIHEFAGQMRLLGESAETIQQLGSAALHRAESTFSSQVICKSWLRFYENAFADWQPR